MYDVIIIGAGASGVMCALTLKEKNKRLKVLLLEKNDKLGKKLSITGNGRCNLGNINNDISNFNSNSSLNSFKKTLEIGDFTFLNTINSNKIKKNYFDYLTRFGVLITKEKDYLYPCSMQAVSVCKSFERYLSLLNVAVKYKYDVTKVVKNEDFFVVNDCLKGKVVVVATGGKSYPKTGCLGFGYKVLKSFGHTITDLYPSLTSLKTDYKHNKDLQGVRVNAVCSLSVDGKIEREEKGQVQFTHDSLSGICIFNLSRGVKRRLNDGEVINVIIDLVPDYSITDLQNYLTSFSSYKLQDALSCVINNKLANTLAKDLKLSNVLVKNLLKKDLENVCFSLKNLCFNIVDTGSFDTAQVTMGGAKLNEFTANLESTKCKGLFAIGEVLDVDGKCGGYNLSWAFNSALIVADYVSRKIS